MALSIFEDKSKTPSESDLQQVLGGTFVLWNEVKSFVFSSYPDAVELWNYSGKNYGWGFRLRDKKRVLVYLTPCDGYFKFSMVLGEKATIDALAKVKSNEIRNLIEIAPVYAEGRGFRIDVKNDQQIEDLKTLILIKIKN